MGRIEKSGLKVDRLLAEFIAEALPGTGVSEAAFWRDFAVIVCDLGPKNRALLERRAVLQGQIDAWHLARRGQPQDAAAQAAFLREIGYLVPEGPAFQIETEGVDPEIACIAGPQLVVPITNARYALNAANARWGSLYDALYGTDALGDAPPAGGFDAARGGRVVAWAKAFLDAALPLDGALWAEVTGLAVKAHRLQLTTAAGAVVLRDPSKFAGYRPEAGQGGDFFFVNNGLHLAISVDAGSAMGAGDPAAIADVLLEAAVSTIMDCEDSVACVDAADKIGAYRNWLGLMRGDLVAEFVKGGKQQLRQLNPDLGYVGTDGAPVMLKGRSLMLIRNVGHLMTTPAVLDPEGREIGEGLLDAMVTVMIAMHDLNRDAPPRNATRGSVYVVKPKMHGPEEVAFADLLFSRVELALGLPSYTVKLGIMDEERRTSVNLAECIRAAKRRVAFINTGFLDRTGDEIHTAMEAGPVVRKGAMKAQPWIAAYEDRNVDIGLAAGLMGRAQIGKGMWAAPELMAAMLAEKAAHPQAGATTAWVPSPTAAVLHATHYHRTPVQARQRMIMASRRAPRLDDLLTLPLAVAGWSADEIADEIENNAQGILGYVVRWVDQGIGCSTVPDIHDVGLMEDRATCRISAQMLANWLHHGVVSRDEMMAAMRKMAVVVDRQNKADAAYRPMAPGYDGPAFQAACELVFEGRDQPSGYTEPALHRWRQLAKQAAG